jgi:S-formylglutathione hydrolase FrmB
MKGSTSVQEIKSRALEGNPLGDPTVRATPVYLPPGYADSGKRYPVAYFLHGYSGTSMQALSRSPFEPTQVERLDKLVADQAIPEVIGVWVDGWTSLGGCQWVNSEASGRYRDYLVQDVVGFIDKNFRTVANGGGRALLGKSSGGYGTLAVARHHPNVFGHIACHSGDAYFEYCYMPDFPKAAGAYARAGGPEAWLKQFRERAATSRMRSEDHAPINTLAMAAAYSAGKGGPLNLELPFDLETGRLKAEVWNRWLGHDPVRFIPRHADAFKKLQTVFIDCGLRDEFNLQWGARMVVQELRTAGVDARHEEFEDGHMGISYRYERSLTFLVPRLTA